MNSGVSNSPPGPADHRLPPLVALPLVVGGIAAASIGGFPVVLLLPLFAAILARVLLEDEGRAFLHRRLRKAAAWLLVAAPIWYVFARGGESGRGPLIALLSYATLCELLWLAGTQSAFGTFLLVLMSATQVLGVAFLAKDVRGLLLVVAYIAALAPGVVQFERYAFSLSRGRREPGVRYIAVAGGTVPPIGATLAVSLRLLALGLPLGLLLYGTLPRVDRAGSSREGPESAQAGRAADDAPGAGVAPSGERSLSQGTTGARVGAKLGFVATMKRDLSGALRVKPAGAKAGDKEPSGPPLLLRSTAYTDFDGTIWDRSAGKTLSRMCRDADDGVTDGWIPVFVRPLEGAAASLLITDLRGGLGRQMFLAPEAEAVRFVRADGAPCGVVVPLDGTALAQYALAAGDGYEERARVPSADPRRLLAARSDASIAPLAAYVQPPPDAAELRQLAQSVVGSEKRPSARAERIAHWLSTTFTYTLAVPEVDPRRPVQDFLLRVRRGHCEYFASAMTLLLRALGHPARLAVGYRGGDWQESIGEYLVRGSNAHAWTEMWFEGVGWVNYDPTPPDSSATDSTTMTRSRASESEDGDDGAAERLLRYSKDDRRWFGSQVSAAFEAVLVKPARFLSQRAVLPFVAGALVLGLAVLVSRRRRRIAAAQAGGAAAPAVPSRGPYQRALQALGKAGVVRKRSQTPEEFLRVATVAVPSVALPFARLTNRFEVERYGGGGGASERGVDAVEDAEAVRVGVAELRAKR